MSLVKLSHHDSVVVLTLNRPNVLNAISDALLDELDAHLDVLEADASCRGVVLTGEGRAFCAGSDLSGEHQDPDARIKRMHALVQRLQSYPKTTFACINGLALGGGLELAVACTFRIADVSAKMGLPEVKLGLIPLYGGTQILPSLIGANRALELMMTGGSIDARRAYAIGLVNRVVDSFGDRKTLIKEALLFANEICGHSMVPQQALRTLIREMGGKSVAEGLQLEWKIGKFVAESEDAKEGVKAFIEKRQPIFRDC